MKALFRHRLRFTLLHSIVATWFIESVWMWWQAGGSQTLGLLGSLTCPFSPWVLVRTLVSWATVALPVTVLRKVFLTPNRSREASPRNIIKSSLTLKSTRIAAATYLTSAITALLIHIITVYTSEVYHRGDPKLTIFVRSKKHPHYLNGRLLFLILTQITTALAFTLRGAMADRFAYRWAFAFKTKDAFLPLTIAVSYVVSVVFTSLAIFAAATIFALARLSLPALYQIPFVSIFLRPFTAHFLKGPWTFSLLLNHYTVWSRAWLLGFSTFLNWEIADSLFENVVAGPTPLSSGAADPNTVLVSGVASTNRIFQFFAYSELRELSMDDSTSASTRRTALFGDPKSSLNLWGFFVRESLLLLGQDYQTFLRRGKPVPAPAAPPPPKPKIELDPKIVTPAPFLRQRVFKATAESPRLAALDALASDGPIAKVVDAGADATHVPELFRSVEKQVLASPAGEEGKKIANNALAVNNRLNAQLASLSHHLVTNVPDPLKDTFGRLTRWWSKERLSKVVEASLPFRELDVVVLDSLSHLVCASLTEDRYGIVQRDIPKILEAMVSFLVSVEEYQREMNALVKPPTGPLSDEETREMDALLVEVHKAQETLGYMADSLKESLARIVRTFGDKLLAFKFPPRIASTLQGFLDYS